MTIFGRVMYSEPVGVEPLQVEGRHRPGGGTEKHQSAADPQGVEGSFERIFPDAVIDHVDSRPRGQFTDPCSEAFVAQHMIGTGLAGQLLLVSVETVVMTRRPWP